MEKTKAHNRVEMIGKIYNSWKVLEHSHTNGKIAYYKCECLECSSTHIVDGRNIRSGLSKRCTSCGLKATNKSQAGTKKSKKTSVEIAEQYLMHQKMKSARSRGHAWALTLENFKDLIYKDCDYCGEAPCTTVNPTKGMALQQSRATECFITYNGIDRVDSNLGYVENNVVTCCQQCNRAKLDYTKEKFIAWARKLVKHQDSKKV